MEPNSTACLMCFLRSISTMHTPMPLGKGEPMRITTGSFVDGYLKEPRKRLLKKSPSSKIGSTTILKNAWTTSLPENFFLLTNLNLKFGIFIQALKEKREAQENFSFKIVLFLIWSASCIYIQLDLQESTHRNA